MAKINTWQEVMDIILQTPELKMEVYTSYILAVQDLLYGSYEIINDDAINLNMIKVYPVSIWIEGDIRKKCILHIETEANLPFISGQTDNISIVKERICKMMKVLDIKEHHMEIQLTEVVMDVKKYPTAKWIAANSVLCLLSNLYTDKDEAFRSTVNRFNSVSNQFFKSLKRKTKSLMKQGTKQPRSLTLAYNSYTASSISDIANFKKIIWLNHRIYSHSFKKFHQELSIAKRKYKGADNIPIKELETIVSYADASSIAKYHNLICLYHLRAKIGNTNDSRVKYSRTILRKD